MTSFNTATVTIFAPSSNVPGSPLLDGNFSPESISWNSGIVDISFICDKPFTINNDNLTINQIIDPNDPSSPYVNGQLSSVSYRMEASQNVMCTDGTIQQARTNVRGSGGENIAIIDGQVSRSNTSFSVTETINGSECPDTYIMDLGHFSGAFCGLSGDWTGVLFEISITVQWMDCRDSSANAFSDSCRVYCRNTEGPEPGIVLCEEMFYRPRCLNNFTDPEIIPDIRNDAECREFYKNYVAREGPIAELDLSLSNYCLFRYPNGLNDFVSDQQTAINTELCACNLPPSDYLRVINNAVTMGATGLSSYANNAKCLFFDCATSPYKSIETINAGVVCPTPQCINFVNITNNGEINSDINISQINTCVSRFEQTNSPGTNSPGTNSPGTNSPGTNSAGTNNSTSVFQKWWFWLAIGGGILLIIIIIAIVISSKNKKSPQ